MFAIALMLKKKKIMKGVFIGGDDLAEQKNVSIIHFCLPQSLFSAIIVNQIEKKLSLKKYIIPAAIEPRTYQPSEKTHEYRIIQLSNENAF